MFFDIIGTRLSNPPVFSVEGEKRLFMKSPFDQPLRCELVCDQAMYEIFAQGKVGYLIAQAVFIDILFIME